MKRHYDYTDAELLELYNNDKLGVLIDLECAYQGAPLLPVLPIEPVKIEMIPDLLLFTIGGLKFSKLSDASELLEYLRGIPLFETEYAPGARDYSTMVCKKLNPEDYSYPKIEQKQVYSPEEWERAKKGVIDYQAQKAEYEKAKKEYDAAVKAREEVTKEIFDRINDYRDLLWRLDRAKSIYARYLDLAEGDHNIAGRFMDSAEHDLWEEFRTQLYVEQHAKD